MAPETALEPTVATPPVTPSTSTTTTSPSAGSTTPAASQPAPSWDEDPRAKGLIADLQRERKARQDHERRATEAITQAAEYQRQVQAMAGIKTPTKDEADEQAVRDRFAQLYPHLADLSPEDIETLREMKSQGHQTTQFIEQQWTNHHGTLLNLAHETIAKDLGDLAPRQRARINAAYVQEAEQHPEFMAKIERGDKAAVLQFAKEYLEDFVGPITRNVQRSEAGRFRPVPSGKDRSLPMKGDKPIDVTDNDAVMKMLVESRKGQFGRR